MSHLEGWLSAFVLTVAIELPVVLVLTRDSALAWQRRSAFVLCGQLMTHPLVWFVFPIIPGITGRTALTLSELWAWLGEAALYALAGVAPTALGAIGVAAVANAMSLAIGLLLYG
jgi:hypothetical protein